MRAAERDAAAAEPVGDEAPDQATLDDGVRERYWDDLERLLLRPDRCAVAAVAEKAPEPLRAAFDP